MIKVRNGSWYLEYEGGRTADVFHVTKDYPLDCTEVGDFDWNPEGGGPARQTAEVTRADCKEALG
jgi:hypothetical protein